MELLEDRVLFDAVPDAIDIVDTAEVDNLTTKASESMEHTASDHSSSADGRHEIVFIDGSVDDIDKLLADLMLDIGPGTVVNFGGKLIHLLQLQYP